VYNEYLILTILVLQYNTANLALFAALSYFVLHVFTFQAYKLL